MVMKHYPAQFKADAVALYRSRPGATIAQIADDLGVNRETLRSWVRADDQRRGVAAGPAGPPGGRLGRGRERRVAAADPGARGGTGHSAEGGPVFRRGDALVNRFQFVADHRQRYGVKRLCQIIGLSRSSFYYWRPRPPARAAREAADAALAGRIRAVHTAHDGTYGAPRITAELREPGLAVNRKRVARVMRSFGVQGLRLRRRTRTTVPDPAAAKAPDLIGRDFTAPAPNQRYVGDITYLPVGERGFLYLATVLDLHSRRLTGWAIANHMRTDLVIDAFHAAQRTRGSLDGAIMHTDHGAQYTSRAFAEACARPGSGSR